MRIPVTLKPVALAAPVEVTGSVAAGSVGYRITGGEAASVKLTPTGLAESQATTGSILTGQQKQVPFAIAAGTSLTRVDLDSISATADLDLALYKVVGGTPTLVGQSATSSGDERIDLLGLEAGQYVAVVDGYDTGGVATDYRLDVYNVNPGTDQGGFTVSPNPVKLAQGGSATVTAKWSGLDASKRYLGWVGYSTSPSLTLVTVK